MIWVDRSDFLQQKSRALARHCTIFAYCTINSAGSMHEIQVDKNLIDADTIVPMPLLSTSIEKEALLVAFA